MIIMFNDVIVLINKGIYKKNIFLNLAVCNNMYLGDSPPSRSQNMTKVL